jgi:large subunit ribosomal protein L3
MSETQDTESKLNGIFAFKVGMSSIYGDNGEVIPVTILKYENQYVSRLKTKESDGYEAVQVAFRPKNAKRSLASEKGSLKAAGFENGAYFVREMRQALKDITLGSKVSINSLVKGDIIAATSKSKGRGFAGSVKRYNFRGGPASHGSKFHRQPGSSGNRTWPGRVMPGKKFPGQFGFKNITVRNLKVVDVIPEENVVLIKGSIPGAPNTLVTLKKINP